MRQMQVTLKRVLSPESGVVSQNMLKKDSRLKTQDSRLAKHWPSRYGLMRFLTAYFALQDGEVILTGSERMKQRPIGILVNALRELGAKIDYVENEGFPPIKYKREDLQQATNQDQHKRRYQQSVHYRFIADRVARLSLGLELHIEGELTSRPYVQK